MYPERVVIRALTRWHPEGECWISDYSVGTHGYAQIGWHEKGKNNTVVAHRIAWWGANRKDFDGKTVDHICRVRRCVNPLHLRLIVGRENSSDNGSEKRVKNPLTGTQCRKGHNKSRSLLSGKVYCRECQAAWARSRRQESC